VLFIIGGSLDTFKQIVDLMWVISVSCTVVIYHYRYFKSKEGTPSASHNSAMVPCENEKCDNAAVYHLCRDCMRDDAAFYAQHQ